MSSSYLYRGPQSPRDEPVSSFSPNGMGAYRSPDRVVNNMAGMSSSEVRGGLTRRFTTNALPTLSPIGQQRLQAAGDSAMSLAYNRVAPSERKIRHIENLLEQQRRINAELEQVDNETRREVEEGLRHERAASQFIASSEPTTPPGLQDAFPTTLSRPNRYSTTSLTSPSTMASRPNRSSTQLNSPPLSLARPYTAHNSSTFPSSSVPPSRRHSDDEEDEEFLFTYDNSLNRAAAHPNRNSMPVTYNRKRSAADLSAALGPLNTTSFLFDDDERLLHQTTKPNGLASSPENKTYLQMQHTPDGFPKLIRREDNVEQPTSGASAALDLALSHGKTADVQANGRAGIRRHRISLPPTALSSNGAIAPLNSILAASGDIKPAASNRHSVEVKFSTETKRPSILTSPSRGTTDATPKNAVSYSTNDIPTLKSINGNHSHTASISSPPNKLVNGTDNKIPEQNGSGFSPSNTARQGQELTVPSLDAFNALHNNLQGGLGAFGSVNEPQMQPFSAPNIPFANPAFYGNYGMHMLNSGFNTMNLNGPGYGPQPQWTGPGPLFQQVGGVPFQQNQQRPVVAGTARFPRPAVPATQTKQEADDMYNAVGIQQLQGQIYGLCKDQHGCRFLQRKLDERREQDVQLIFDEVKDYFIELMTDPFGNYLCQRLLEHANNDQRTVLIKNAAPSMTSIAVNQHGTRALQRMIEFISTREQIALLIEALGNDVVQLIQDLNGNHVIQKCLNHLTSEDAEFIFGAVGTNCVVVGTHRHGCCVLQRCVDHATGHQKNRLVNCIIENALALVQDPFGNYVVQYVLDLSEPTFTQPLCVALSGHIALLSKQKFSSNVIEKCMRCADKDTRRIMIKEIMNPGELEKLIRDSYANYVVQTAMEYCPEDIKTLFIDTIRPVLPNIRNTPHGRRIATKIQDYDFPGNNNWIPSGPKLGQNGATGPGTNTPQSPNGRTNRMGIIGAPSGQWNSSIDPTTLMNGYNMASGQNNAQPTTNFQNFDVQTYPKHGMNGGAFNGTSNGIGVNSTQPFGHL